eukprot:CAMPEP_0203667348 /NCGR_PEP_ID=MMETSP0090-20130426/4186_1 /ASSEMBLY_ACC=CAM_ASM_001088 /TAXON_ID=426623 /ORGANISM="Chaetoceros affinis, Strain CCMP159" /LENGTH=561 /DNA_ID=CAMNT_0050531469 /DNA_START=127 /DNA_END=1812 /DNA_ORIENTATION=-
MTSNQSNGNITCDHDHHGKKNNSKEEGSIFYYIDYSHVPPTKQDQDNYRKKLRYYIAKNHANTSSQWQQHQGRMMVLTNKIDHPATCERPETSSSTISAYSHKQREEQQNKGQELNLNSRFSANSWEDEYLDPEIFERQGRGNAKKMRTSVVLCHHHPTSTMLHVENEKHGDDFIGFMGTSFPVRLHDLLSKPSFARSENTVINMDHISSVITWLPHGRAWIVRDGFRFTKCIAMTHFNFTHYKSFLRQVTAWGFTRIEKGPDSGSYYHPLFLRGMPHLTKFMRRKSAASTTQSSTSLSSVASALAHYEGKETRIKIEDKTNPKFCEMSKRHPIPTNHYIVTKNEENDSYGDKKKMKTSTVMNEGDCQSRSAEREYLNRRSSFQNSQLVEQQHLLFQKNELRCCLDRGMFTYPFLSFAPDEDLRNTAQLSALSSPCPPIPAQSFNTHSSSLNSLAGDTFPSYFSSSSTPQNQNMIKDTSFFCLGDQGGAATSFDCSHNAGQEERALQQGQQDCVGVVIDDDSQNKIVQCGDSTNHDGHRALKSLLEDLFVSNNAVLDFSTR